VIGEGSGVVKWRIERFGSRSTLEHVAIIEVWVCGRCLSVPGYQCLTKVAWSRDYDGYAMT